MNLGYTYAVDRSVVEVSLSLPKVEREKLARAFHQLAGDPFQTGDSELPRPGRPPFRVTRFGHWLVTWWTDHPVREVRIVAIERISLHS